MGVDVKKLIRAIKTKRDAEGLSLRKLSSQIGVSFSTLARIERGEGEPDNNSLLRMLDWLGADGAEAGLQLENVALVHFRASKNVRSKTTECLLKIAQTLRSEFQADQLDQDPPTFSASEIEGPTLVLSKPEMEEMSARLRSDLELSSGDALNALSLKIEGVAVYVPSEVTSVGEECVSFLINEGAMEWSAMSVPLNHLNDRWAILRNDKHSIERQRVTYLEECWHIFLGHKLTKVAKIGDAYGRTYESSEEHDAFYLASATLLPESAVRDAVEKGKTAAQIGETFGVSPELVEYRVKRMGLWRVYKDIGVKISI